MQVKSFGCSYIFGSELPDEIRKIDETNRRSYFAGSQLTWPCLVAKNYGYPYNTYARPGSGNLQILERLLSNLSGSINNDILCIIGWTWIDRFDYCIEKSQWPGMPWSTLMPIDDNEVAKIYYRDLHSEIRDKFVNLLYIKQAIDALKSKSIPFIMTYMDHLLFDDKWNTTPAIVEMQTYIKPYMTQFDELNFQQWTKKNKFPISTIGHPLEQAHYAASKYIIQALDTKSIGVHCHLV
jgi:hypothetical protein